MDGAAVGALGFVDIVLVTLAAESCGRSSTSHLRKWAWRHQGAGQYHAVSEWLHFKPRAVCLISNLLLTMFGCLPAPIPLVSFSWHHL